MAVMNFEDEDSETAIFMALGRASVCWEETPKGVFDSTTCKEVGEELLAHLRKLRLAPDPDHFLSARDAALSD